MRARTPSSRGGASRRVLAAWATAFLLCVARPAAAGAAAPAPPPQPPATPPPAPVEAELPPMVVHAPPDVVTPSRTTTPVLDVPRAVDVVTKDRIRERAPLSVLDALDDQLGVWIEKKTSQTSDPVVRGLSGGNLLALVDGNTLSTFWGEGGFATDDMYGKIDPETVERIEVVRGPSSVLYGSNALGGVINFITRRSPFEFTDRGTRVGGRTRLTYSSVSDLWRARVEGYGASPSFRWLAGASFWDSGDVVDGSGEVQDPTGGYGRFADAALSFRMSGKAVLHLTVQYTENPLVHRFYRPFQENSNFRLAIAPTIELTDLDSAFADSAKIRLYWQDKVDQRRWYSSTTGAQEQWGEAIWKTAQAGVQFDKRLGRHALTYGVDLQATWAESPDDEQFTMYKPGNPPMKAAPDSVWSSFGVFAQDVWAITPRLDLTASVRVDGLRLATDVDDQYVPPGGLDPQADEFTDSETAVVGGLLASYALSEPTRVFGGWTRGFRQFPPKFGVTQHGWGVVVPSQLLDPVTADQFEVGVKHQGAHFMAELTAYHTRFGNFQNIVRGTFQGQDWYDFDGDTVRDAGEDVYVTVGNGDAYVEGIEAGAEVDLNAIAPRLVGRGWTLGGTFVWNYGNDETNDIPIRHTQPARGTAKLRFDDPDERRGLWFEAAAEFVRDYDRIPPDRLANDVGYLEDPRDPASGKRRSWGLPGYSVLDLRAGMNLSRHVTLTVGLENVFDELYRSAHSRMDAPGRNVVVSIDVTF